MEFSNLIKKTKEVEIDGLKFTIKKLPYSFDTWAYIKGLEGADYENVDLDDPDIDKDETDQSVEKPKKTRTKVIKATSLESNIAITVERIYNGVVSWSLEVKNKPAPITREAIGELVSGHPEITQALLEAINTFNLGLSEKNEQS